MLSPWNGQGARGPLSRPGLNVHEGDYLLAVNGAGQGLEDLHVFENRAGGGRSEESRVG